MTKCPVPAIRAQNSWSHQSMDAALPPISRTAGSPGLPNVCRHSETPLTTATTSGEVLDLVTISPGSMRTDGDRIHVDHFPVVAVRVLEAPAVHRAVIHLVPGLASPGVQGGPDQPIHLVPVGRREADDD